MVTSLAASGGPLTPWAGKEAGAWGGSLRVGCWSPSSARDELGKLRLGTGREWAGPGRKKASL